MDLAILDGEVIISSLMKEALIRGIYNINRVVWRIDR